MSVSYAFLIRVIRAIRVQNKKSHFLADAQQLHKVGVAGIVGNCIIDIRQQSRVDAVHSVHVVGQCLGDVPQALRLGLFKRVEILHIIQSILYT